MSSINRQMKRRQEKTMRQNMSKPLGQRLTPNERKLGEKIKEMLLIEGQLEGAAEADRIYKERLLSNVASIKGIGRQRLIEIGKALGFSDIQQILEKRRKHK